MLSREKIKKMLPSTKVLQTSIEGFYIIRRDEAPLEQVGILYRPLTVSILDGYKDSILGNERLRYGRNETMVTGIDMVCSSYISDASPDHPYLAVMLELDQNLILDLLQEIDFIDEDGRAHRSAATAESDTMVLNAYSRLIDLLEMPEKQQKILAPIIIREIYFRLLTGKLGEQIQSLYITGSISQRISRAAAWIRENFKSTFKVEELATRFHMAPSSFYRNFNKVTSLTPIQYQKQLRLYEARRLILSGEDAVNAAYGVGYESSTQFHKEYKRMFGAPPKTDIKNILSSRQTLSI
ncbi:MAG: AraC family transcriptional regulator N-terminal domain-containing protein [Brevinema sp.]